FADITHPSSCTPRNGVSSGVLGAPSGPFRPPGPETIALAKFSSISGINCRTFALAVLMFMRRPESVVNKSDMVVSYGIFLNLLQPNRLWRLIIHAPGLAKASL